MASDWLSLLQAYDTAVVDATDPHLTVARTSSPSLNFTFGKGHGLPLGFTIVLGGPPKGGKTLVANMFTGQIHADYSDGFVAKYNTEQRERVQATPAELQRCFGIDPKRYVAYETNSPMEIFDHIEKEISALCQKGLPLKAVIIDSVNGIQGRRAMNADTIETQQIGDDAKTLGDGFKRVLAVQRKYGFAMILICQIRAEMDRLEQMRGHKVKFAIPFALQHYAEYFMFVEPDLNATARADIEGNKFKEDGDDAFSGKNAEQSGHKILVTMKDSSCGPKGRKGEFTLDYRQGVINVFEEVGKLGMDRGVIAKINNTTYTFGEKKITGGKPGVFNAIKNDPAFQQQVIDELFRRDGTGVFDAEDKLAEQQDE